MPLYVYKCSSCGSVQEHKHPIDDPTPVCGAAETIWDADVSSCGKPALERQITASPVFFERSTGWDGWDRVGPGTIGRVVDQRKHIDGRTEQKNPGSRKAV